MGSVVIASLVGCATPLFVMNSPRNGILPQEILDCQQVLATSDVVINAFISMWTSDIYATEARALPNAVNGSLSSLHSEFQMRDLKFQIGLSEICDLQFVIP